MGKFPTNKEKDSILNLFGGLPTGDLQIGKTNDNHRRKICEHLNRNFYIYVQGDRDVDYVTYRLLEKGVTVIESGGFEQIEKDRIQAKKEVLLSRRTSIIAAVGGLITILVFFLSHSDKILSFLGANLRVLSNLCK